MDSFSRNRMKPRKPKPKILPLDRKVRPNPKYEDIAPSVDTGHNLRKQRERLEEVRQFYKFRPDEIFRRITATSLVSLMLEVAKLEMQQDDIAQLSTVSSSDDVDSAIDHDELAATTTEEEEEEKNHNTLIKGNHDGDSDEDFGYPFGIASTTRSNNTIVNNNNRAGSGIPGSGQSVVESVVYAGKKLNTNRKHLSSSVANLIQGIGDPIDSLDSASVAAMGQESEEEERLQNLEKRPYILLDVRDPSDFSAFHIVSAESYPQQKLAISINFESKSMLRFKNRDEKLIVVYDEDELIASKCASTLVQRGYENVYMLSGGLKVAGILFPEALISRKDAFDTEEEILILEEALEDAMLRKGTSRLSVYAPSVCSTMRTGGGSRMSMSISQPNLHSLSLAAGPAPGHNSSARVPLRRLESAAKSSVAGRRQMSSQMSSAATLGRRTNNSQVRSGFRR